MKNRSSRHAKIDIEELALRVLIESYTSANFDEEFQDEDEISHWVDEEVMDWHPETLEEALRILEPAFEDFVQQQRGLDLSRGILSDFHQQLEQAIVVSPASTADIRGTIIDFVRPFMEQVMLGTYALNPNENVLTT